MTTIAAALAEMMAVLASDDSVRLISGNEALSGRRFAERFDRASARLGRAGIGKDSTVLFAIPLSVEALAHLAALLSTRARVAILDFREPPALVAARLGLIEPDWVITTPLISMATRVPGLRGRIPPLRKMAKRVLTTGSGSGTSSPHHDTPEPGDPALVLFTSGTTAQPKAVVHTQSTLASMLASVTGLIGDAGDEVVLSDQFHSLLPTLASGALCVVERPGTNPDILHLRMREHQVTTWFTTPPNLLDMIRHHEIPATVRRVVVGSAPVTPPLVKEVMSHRPDLELIAVYAMTEVVPVAVSQGEAIVEHQGPGDLVGRPVPGLAITIAGDGEIILSGDRVGSYLGDDSHLVSTGDLGHFTADDQLVLDGRKKDMILVGARNLYPSHYEPLLAEIDGVLDAALVGISDPYGDEALWVAVEKSPGADESAVRSEVLETLDTLPLAGVVFQPLPRSGRSQKLDRQALRESIASLSEEP